METLVGGARQSLFVDRHAFQHHRDCLVCLAQTLGRGVDVRGIYHHMTASVVMAMVMMVMVVVVPVFVRVFVAVCVRVFVCVCVCMIVVVVMIVATIVLLSLYVFI